MGRVWFNDFDHISSGFEDLTVVSPRVTNAYFAKKVVTGGTAATGAGAAAGPTVDFEEINEGILGREVYVIVETENFVPPDQPIISTERANIKIQLKTGDCNLTGTADETIQITNGTADVDEFVVQVGDTEVLNDIEGNCSYTNLDDFADKAIFKLSFRPHTRAVFDTWAETIQDAGTDLPSIEIEVTPEDEELYVLYGTEGNEQGPPLEIGRFANSDGHLFTLENKNVHEIYHGDNLYNSLGTHTHNAQVVRRRIASIENDSSTEVVYYFHNISDNIYEICTCTKSQARRRANGRKVATTSVSANVPSGYAASQNAPAGGDATTNYYYNHFVPSPLYPNDPNEASLPTSFVPDLTTQANFDDYHTIVSIDNPTAAGTDYGVRRYALTNPNNANDLVDLIRMPDTLNISEESGVNELNITFTYRNTQRRYCNPACFAGFLSVLAQLDRNDVVCTGMCFEDATSYPSVTHPNGDSVDTAYLSNLADEQLKVNAFRDNYFTNIYRGSTSWYGLLTNTNYSSGHEDHLHSGDFENNKVLILNT